jgi:hypothetical protein
MSRNRIISAFAILCAITCQAQSRQEACTVQPGTHQVNIPLQGAPDSMEPLCQPNRLRVADRTSLTLHITGLSPLDVCTVSSKPPTVTSVTNPIEAIITSVGGFGAFSGGKLHNADVVVRTGGYDDLVTKLKATLSAYKAPAKAPSETDIAWEARKQKAQDDHDSNQAAVTQFIYLTGQIEGAADAIFTKQAKWQGLYNTDMKEIAKYSAADYRGTRYVNFKPTNPDAGTPLATALEHTKFSKTTDPTNDNYAPNEVDVAKLQGLIDTMANIEKAVSSYCSSSSVTCSADGPPALENLLEWAKQIGAVATDNLKTLQAQQASVVTAYTALKKSEDDFDIRKNQNIIAIAKDKNILVQDIALGPDYGATDTGILTCTNDITSTQATTDAINYSILYQNIPALTASTGILFSFMPLQVIGTQPQLNSDGVTAGTYFAVTNSGSFQVIPMAFVNYKLPFPWLLRKGNGDRHRQFQGRILTTWPGQPEKELVITNNASIGIGVNPNTGTNQVEYFVGDALGFNRIYLHFGAHIGRTERLGGGFTLNTMTPTGFSGTAPVDWSYHAAFSIGLSVRVAPF